MIVRAVPRNAPGTPRFAVVDPKLRQRDGAPVEELYKVLGYLDNFGLSADPHAAILYYRHGGSPLSSYRYRPTDGQGDLFAVRLDPAQPEASRAEVAELAISVLGLLDIPSLAAVAEEAGGTEAGSPGAADPEAFYQAKKAELAAYAGTVPAGVLNVSRQRMRLALGDIRWNALAPPVQAMLATADHLGFTLLADADPADPEGMDFSGPVIGVCASIESLVHEAIVIPAVAREPGLAEKLERATFGAVVALIEQAVHGVKNPRPEHLAVRAHLFGNAFDLAKLAGLLPLLRQVNQRFRTRAAHRVVVRDVDWSALWTTVLKDGLLAEVIDVLMRLPPDKAPGQAPGQATGQAPG
jgi:hypothetical protein